MIRLNKYLATAGIASRRKADELILAGRIKVNGAIARKLGIMIDENQDKVEYNGRTIQAEAEKVYLAVNKPVGYISSASDSQGKSVLELVKTKERLYPVGRLDKDSRGLIILTNDGDLAYHLTHAKFGEEKEYAVTIDRILAPEDARKMEQGMMLGRERVQPIKIVSRHGKHLVLILLEGVNRQIRRMLGRLGYTVLDLQRLRIGKLKLGNLKEGGWKFIKKEDIV